MTTTKLDEKALEALARAYDREDAAQRGEFDPWIDGENDRVWQEERLACAEEAAKAFMSALPAAPAGGRVTEALAAAKTVIQALINAEYNVESWYLEQRLASIEAALAHEPAAGWRIVAYGWFSAKDVLLGTADTADAARRRAAAGHGMWAGDYIAPLYAPPPPGEVQP